MKELNSFFMHHFIFLFLQTNVGADHGSEKGY